MLMFDPFDHGDHEFEDEAARLEWEAKYRWCVHCKADCWVDDPEHAADCPSVTGLWPVREQELQPCRKCGTPAHGMCCMDCGAELKLGDFYVLRDADTGGIASERPHVGEVVCVGCGAMTDV